MLDAQLKRGLLEVCVLRCLADEDSYGYQLVRRLEPAIAVSESTLYPILKRLEAAGALTTYSVEHNGRLRKFYQITDIGREKIRLFLDDWNEMMTIYTFIAKEIRHDET